LCSKNHNHAQNPILSIIKGMVGAAEETALKLRYFLDILRNDVQTLSGSARHVADRSRRVAGFNGDDEQYDIWIVSKGNVSGDGGMNQSR